MKTPKIFPGLFCMLVLFVFINSCKERTITQEPLPGTFQNPPFESSVHAWWHWLDNSITREGITRDLEAMKKQGISTATILNVGLHGERDLGVPQAVFNTEEWYQMFEWALEEADRLGMRIGAHNCDGWSSSVGPWISPENSMKRCTWSRTILEGGIKTDIMLPEPGKKKEYYQDIRVLAFPVMKGISSFQREKPAIILNGSPTGNLLYDGNPLTTMNVKESDRLDIVFKKEFTATKIAIHPRVEFVWNDLSKVHYQVELKASHDGNTFKTIQQFDGPKPNSTTILEITPLTAKQFRLEFSKLEGIQESDMDIAEAELLGQGEEPAYNTHIPCHLPKTVTTMPYAVNDVLVEGTDTSGSVPLDAVMDISQFMTPDGNLKWDAPAGIWEVLRIGYTTTGAQNGPATKAGTGLECDKMDTSALNFHFESFPAKLINHAGKYTGNTFEYLFIDSWECWYQNWTHNFMAEFEKRRHYSMVNWLPVICGITIEDNLATERFLHDFRLTIAELIEENYYRQFNELCHRHGVRSHAEVIYGGTSYPPLDILKSTRYVDVPMTEFWSGFDPETKLVRYEPSRATAFEIPVQAGSVYGKQVIPAEAYTGYANYSESPWELKLFGDRAFCSGINQMVLHSYVHQPFEKKPGVTLGVFGQSFNRHNPWWDFSSQWFTYHARVQYVLQQGVPVADILYFVGDRFYQEANTSGLYEVPLGYFVQKCNLDILMNQCSVKKGKIVLNNGLTYELLLLPDDQEMEPGTLERIAKLVEQGVVVAGPRPVQVPGYLNFAGKQNELVALADKVWGKAGKGESENTYGKGKVYSGMSLSKILEKQGIKPDFSGQQEGMTNLLDIHRKIGTTDVYYVVNQENSPVERECIFRVTGRTPEIWDPVSGKVFKAVDFQEKGGLTHMKILFRPRESLFVIFKAETTPGIQPLEEMKQHYVLQDPSMTLTFEDMPAKAPVLLNSYGSWTNQAAPDIKYYSGKAKYTLDFDLPAGVAAAKPAYISLDEMRVACEITLNDTLLGCAVFPGVRFEVTGLIKEKGNSLGVRVANTWRNRIIGDFTLYGGLKNCWSTSPVEYLPGKDMQLSESGILGPVAFYY